jgi:hypothetical protein
MVIFIQAQDITGMWRTYQITMNNPQRILSAMQSLKNKLPTYRVRAIDSLGRVVDILG